MFKKKVMQLKAITSFAYLIKYPTPVITVLKPKRDENQLVVFENFQVSPSVPIVHYFDTFGNACQRMLLNPGEVRILSEMIVKVDAKVKKDPTADYVLVENLPSEVIQYLLPSRYCLSDTAEIRQLALEIIGNNLVGFLQVQAIANWIHKNVQYQYGFTFSSTTSNDILRNKVGVCRDFAHLGIALCRSINIPARMVVGYLKDLPFEDLHAWFEAYIGGQWFIFDAVQAETMGGRIILAKGRDANDVAFITQFGILTMLSMEVRVFEI